MADEKFPIHRSEEELPVIQSFKAHPLFRGGQAQTLAAFLWPSASPLAADEHLHVSVSEGDELELLVNHPKDEVKGIVYLLHGMGGDAQAAYKVRLTKQFVPEGYLVIRHNHRGMGETVKLAKGIYHSGSAEDILDSLKTIRDRWPGTPIVIVGFSLSGVMLLNLLSRHADAIDEIKELKSAMTVCSPLDLTASSDAIGSLRNKHFDFFFSRTLLAHMLKKNYLTKEDVRKNFRKPTLRQFDEFVTAPRAGFRDAAHYYEQCSPNAHLSKIRLPTTILAAADDPIVPVSTVKNIEHSSAVTVRLEESGGHMGFLGRHLTPHNNYRWMDYFIYDWAKKSLS